MKGVALYMAGGGPSRTGRAALRQGMDHFLQPVKQRARKRSLSWRLVPCGSRQETSHRARNACENPDPEQTQALLDDSEAAGTLPARAHLRDQASNQWDFGFSENDTVRLMVQFMETWIVAAPKALVNYCGRGFDVSKLPARLDFEEELKASVERALKAANWDTGKGIYHKIRHASELLKRPDHPRVEDRCRHCKRLFNAPAGILGAT